jgi:Cu(I)/Ag(I) efflux system protein CusF
MNAMLIRILILLTLTTVTPILAAESMAHMDMSQMPMTATVKTVTKTAQGSGVIQSIDLKNGMLVLQHQAIPALNWPAMTMGFKVSDQLLLKGLKMGQSVRFTLKAEGMNAIVTAVSLAK